MSQEKFHHIPVMPIESIEALNIRPDGVYVDGTLGGGGHSRLILDKLTTGKLIGIDQDKEALQAATELLYSSDKFIPIKGNFHDLANILRDTGINKIDGLLLDLGVSSHQLDTPARGFSFRFDGPLDMRMDVTKPIKAETIVNSYSEDDLADVFSKYGEERFSKRIAREVCKKRSVRAITSTKDLAEIIIKTVPKSKFTNDSVMRVFMALRILVNNELAPLGETIEVAVNHMNKGSRIAIISFHSLEDRIVKTTYRSLQNPCNCPRDIPTCVCGLTPLIKIITKKPITPSHQELSDNTRAHSAKLRVA